MKAVQNLFAGLLLMVSASTLWLTVSLASERNYNTEEIVIITIFCGILVASSVLSSWALITNNK